MRKLCRFTSFILILSMIMSLASCGGDGKDVETTAVETAPPIDPVAVETYTAALDALSTYTAYTQNISIKTTKYIGNEIIEESIERNCEFSNTDSNEFTSKISENKFIGGSSVSTVEVFKAGNIYLEYKGSIDSLYTSKATRDSYLSQQIPLAALDLELYGSVSADSSGNSVINLELPTALESWVTEDDVTINTATATVKMNSDGSVDSFTYSADYINGIAHIVSEYTIDIDLHTETDAPEVHSHDKYKSVSDIRIPKIINEALCYTSGSFTGSATSVISASSYATAARTEINGKYYAYGNSADDHVAKAITTITNQVVDEISTSTETQTYKNGVLTIDNGEAVTETEANTSVISNQITEILSEHIISPDLMASASIDEENDYIVLDFTGTEKLGLIYEQYAALILHGDPAYILDRSHAYTTDSITGYICIDKDTMLPCSLGINFSGKHTVNESDCPVRCNISCSICTGDINVYKEITGDFITEKEPDTKAEPLLYKISTYDGNFIYILSAVSVGDEKTAYLPDEIYSAVTDCDSVAVEFNSKELDLAIENDSEFAKVVYESCYYTDGLPASKRYIDEDLYSNAARIMKAAGCYINFDIMRPSLLKEHIYANYISTVSDLQADKSPENRILAIAGKNDMEIKSLETAENYIRKHSSYSAETQDYILKTITEESRQDYISHTKELYKLWFKGYEDGIRKALVETTLPEDASEEDYTAYMEYHRISVEEPAERILETTKEYLKNGESVFCVIDINYLFCENGIIDGLKNEGYSVETITYEDDTEEAA